MYVCIYVHGQCGYYFLDVDECSLSNSMCEQQCRNSIGTFQCICVAGYTLASDGSSCDGNVNLRCISTAKIILLAACLIVDLSVFQRQIWHRFKSKK